MEFGSTVSIMSAYFSLILYGYNGNLEIVSKCIVPDRIKYIYFSAQFPIHVNTLLLYGNILILMKGFSN
jgi:hypothetical protein